MDALTARRTLAQVRLAIGIGALVAPRVTGKIFGIDSAANPAAPYLARLFGARELFMAAPFLMPAPGLDESELASRAVPVDAVDALASLAGGLRGYLPCAGGDPGDARRRPRHVARLAGGQEREAHPPHLTSFAPRRMTRSGRFRGRERSMPASHPAG